MNRKTALDEALRRMVRTCPVPRRVRFAADRLAEDMLLSRQAFARQENA